MMAQTDSFRPPFTVEIVPMAWRQIAQLSQDMYRLLREQLRTLADLATVGRHPGAVRTARIQASMSFEVGEFIAQYEVDPRSRVIRLLEVAHPGARADVAGCASVM
jgi:mRNA-degrading endonuclease RelE of RelBE toxin-antitoxin system